MPEAKHTIIDKGMLPPVQVEKRFVKKVRETNVEDYLRKKVKANGGLCLKWVSPGFKSVMDRIVLWPGHPVEFVEAKAPGKKADKRQQLVKRDFEEMGYTCNVLDTKEKVDKYIDIKKLL